MEKSCSIIIPALLRDCFALAFKHNRVVIFHAPCGSGKTAVALELLKGEKTCYLSATQEDFSLDQVDSKCKVVIVDDLHLLESSVEKAALCEHLRMRNPSGYRQCNEFISDTAKGNGGYTGQSGS